MKKLLVVLILMLPAFLNAQAVTKKENIKILFHLMQTDSVVEKTMKSMLPMLMKSANLPKDAASASRVDSVTNKMTHIMLTITNRLINEDMVELYDKYYTEQDVKQLVAFYKSTTGQKMISVTPDLNKEMMMILFTKYVPEIEKMVRN